MIHLLKLIIIYNFFIFKNFNDFVTPFFLIFKHFITQFILYYNDLHYYLS